MKRVDRDASLHEKAVQAVAAEDLSYRRARKGRGPARNSRVVDSSVEPELWDQVRAALRPGERLVIVSPTEFRTVYERG